MVGYRKYFGFLTVTLAIFCTCAPSKKNIPVAEQSIIVEEPVAVIDSIKIIDHAKTDSFLENLLQANRALFDSVLAYRKEWNVQIIYTQVDRGNNGIPQLQHYYFNVDPAKYFYPASTVKFPISLLALQKINELKEKGIDRNTTMVTEAATNFQTAVYNDPTTADGKPSIAQYIKKILMVSDNDAYNRLYEFLGQEYINEELHKKGYDDAQILHRLQIALPEAVNRQTNPVKFLGVNNTVLYEQLMQTNKTPYAQRNDSMGKAFYQGGKINEGPMNFSKKNRISLKDLHTILISLVFPEKVSAKQRFNITEDDRQFVLKYMSQFPTESIYPDYSDTANYWPAYCKFILFGGEKSNPPKKIRIFNKPGDAYGQMLDVAYVVDYEKGVEFFLSAVIYCNSDGILNDDTYDYKTIGRPFMKNLGQVIYDHEVKRPKKNLPDLSPFKFNYDKQ